jgi:hypothetical protein
VSVTLFAGPSLAGLDGPLPEIFQLRPPARQGDVFQAARLRPEAIALVDGVFEGVPSVWHKEILWALSLGIPVFGASSMGALRAAELDAYGMIGIGRIYSDYRSGALEADDEVALLHGPEETGYLPLTEPLVNVRATCRAAEGAGVLSAGGARTVLGNAAALFYKERTWPRILAGSAEAELSHADQVRFKAWLPAGRVDQKRADALAMIDFVAELCARNALPKAEHDFQPTFLWERAVAKWTAATPVMRQRRKLGGAETLAGLLADAALSSRGR